MSFCLIIATAQSAQGLGTLVNQAESALKDLYPAHVVLRQDWGWCSVVTSRQLDDRRSPWVLSDDGTLALVSAGSWFYGNTLASGQEQALLNLVHDKSFSKILDNIEGVFGIALLDKQAKRIEIAVDPAGSYHVYRVQWGDVLLVSDSALTLAAITGAKLDPESVHQFIATGIVYGTRSLWQNFTKLTPADYLKIEAFNLQIDRQTYWHFSHIRPEKHNAKEGVARIVDALTATAKNINSHFPNALCDLTGGYDSRATIAGFLLANVKVSTTVSGSEDSPDARVAKIIADQFGLPHRRVERNATRTYQDLLNALLLTDGEYDVFEYAGIAATHQGHVDAGHDISINGSFGELARGYWWELLFPKIGAKNPLDSVMLARKRFAANAYKRSIFSDEVAAMDLVALLAQQVELQNHGLLSFPNTTQMDHAYFSMRMQRWQGRIASSTNRIWPAVSPFAFRPILQPVLETKANARLRSLVVRTMFANHLPALGQLPLEHGYPAMPATIRNISQFTPVISHYGSRITGRLTRRWHSKASTTSANSGKTIAEDAQLLPLLAVPHLCASGLFNPETLQQFMLAPENQGSSEQWRRLFTLEMAVAKVLQLANAICD
jgi:asparagine synthase (glutamine-hydrolysing)